MVATSSSLTERTYGRPVEWRSSTICGRFPVVRINTYTSTFFSFSVATFDLVFYYRDSRRSTDVKHSTSRGSSQIVASTRTRTRRIDEKTTGTSNNRRDNSLRNSPVRLNSFSDLEKPSSQFWLAISCEIDDIFSRHNNARFSSQDDINIYN